MKLKLFYLAIATIGLISLSACDDDDSPNPPAQNIPEAVVKGFQTKYPDVDPKIVEWEQNGVYYIAEYKKLSNMEDVEAWFTTAGEWKMTETDFGKNLFLLPTLINEAFNKTDYNSWTIDDIKLYEYPDESRNFYLFEVEKAGQPTTNLFFKPDGTLIKTAPDTGTDINPDTVI